MIHNPRTHDIVLWGQGEMHLRVALERLKDRFGVNVKSQPPAIGYRETIRKSVTQRGRHKKQSGGHGQFGDVVLEVKPLPRGARLRVRREGRRRRRAAQVYRRGRRGRGRRPACKGRSASPSSTSQVTLTDGSYHSVDSSDLAFRTAARIGVARGAAAMRSRCCWSRSMWSRSSARPRRPRRSTPSCRARRGQILGFDTREGWPGWDRVRAMMPEAEIGDLIVELRSATAGAGSFTRAFDHMAEVTGRAADQIIAAHSRRGVIHGDGMRRTRAS